MKSKGTECFRKVSRAAVRRQEIKTEKCPFGSAGYWGPVFAARPARGGPRSGWAMKASGFSTGGWSKARPPKELTSNISFALGAVEDKDTGVRGSGRSG